MSVTDFGDRCLKFLSTIVNIFCHQYPSPKSRGEDKYNRDFLLAVSFNLTEQFLEFEEFLGFG